MGIFLLNLNTMAMNVALPGIGRTFGGSIAGLQWIVDAYTLMFAALLLFRGHALRPHRGEPRVRRRRRGLHGRLGGLRTGTGPERADRRPPDPGERGGDHAALLARPCPPGLP